MNITDLIGPKLATMMTSANPNERAVHKSDSASLLLHDPNNPMNRKTVVAI